MKNPLLTSAGIARHLAKGHGEGVGANYKPWLEVRHVPSSGKSSRIVGWKTGRIHTFLSQLELRCFYALEWNDDITDIREQFPLLPQDETKEISQKIGVKHPKEPKAETEMVMSTDFLVTLATGAEIAYSAKYAQDLEDPRTIEKLEIERLYWKQRSTEWKIITEKEIDVTFAKNIEWLHPKKAITSLNPLRQKDIEAIQKTIELEIFAGFRPLNEISSEADERLGYRAGSTLAAIRHLLANKIWVTNMNARLEPNKPAYIKPNHEISKKRSIRMA